MDENDDFGIPEEDARCERSCKVYRIEGKWQVGYTTRRHIVFIESAKYTEKRIKGDFGIPD